MYKENKIFKIKNLNFESLKKILVIGVIDSNHNHNFSKTIKLINEAKISGIHLKDFEKILGLSVKKNIKADDVLKCSDF